MNTISTAVYAATLATASKERLTVAHVMTPANPQTTPDIIFSLTTLELTYSSHHTGANSIMRPPKTIAVFVMRSNIALLKYVMLGELATHDSGKGGVVRNDSSQRPSGARVRWLIKIRSWVS
jgi:hypothetical protein